MFRLLGKTHPGAVREQNEDAFYSNDSTGLAAVVDGMGGYAAGEVASAIIVESLGELNPSAGGLVAALMECHTRILQHSQVHPESKGMGAAFAGLATQELICSTVILASGGFPEITPTYTGCFPKVRLLRRKPATIPSVTWLPSVWGSALRSRN